MNITMNEIEAVLFDLDGTLVDSMWMWKDIDIEYLGAKGIELPPTLQKDIEGMSFSETAVYFKETFQLPDTLDEIKACWNRMAHDKYVHQVPLKPYAADFLNAVKQMGIPMGIATSNSRELVDAALEALGVREYFGSVTTACEVAAGKPSPDIYLKVAENLGASPEKCLVFEDVPAGILAGKRAGIKVIAIDDDFSACMEEEKRQLADEYIIDYSEMLKIMEV